MFPEYIFERIRVVERNNINYFTGPGLKRDQRGQYEISYDETETDQQIQDAMKTMNPDHRVVIVLKHFHGMSYREMAEIVGVPEKTVKSRLFTARQQLKEILVKQGIVR